jgi:hypothetical protein
MWVILGVLGMFVYKLFQELSINMEVKRGECGNNVR